MDIVITIPKNTSISDYRRELAAAENGAVMNFKVPFLPRKCNVGDKCYLCYNNEIIGYMVICGLSNTGFICTTTGKKWEGCFIQRTGKLHKLEKRIPFQGFRGFRYFNK